MTVYTSQPYFYLILVFFPFFTIHFQNILWTFFSHAFVPLYKEIWGLGCVESIDSVGLFYYCGCTSTAVTPHASIDQRF